MKILKKAIPFLLLICLFVSLCGSASAYNYTVRIFTGSQGTINGQTCVVNPASFSVGDVSLNDGPNGKYFVKGIRESGKDINPYLTSLPANITHDTDYVVVYGLNTDLVTVTIEYLRQSDNTRLATSRTLIANRGDKPTV